MFLDDIVVTILASRLFVQLAPPAAAQRALVRLGRVSPDEPDREVWDIWDEDEDTISGDWRIVDEE